MSTGQVQLERRVAQRFDLQIPVSVLLNHGEREGSGFTQNLSAKGALLCTGLPLAAGDELSITLIMPSQITLGEDMRVRCRGRVLRVQSSGLEAKYLIAVQLRQYEYLPQKDELPAWHRVPAVGARGYDDEAELTALRSWQP